MGGSLSDQPVASRTIAKRELEKIGVEPDNEAGPNGADQEKDKH